MSAVHDQLMELVQRLDNQQAEKALQLLIALHSRQSSGEMGNPKREYREEDDPILNGTLLFDGPEDLSETFEDMVKEKIKRKLWKRDE